MHWTTHVLTGAAVGFLVERPAAAVVAGIAGHVALDTFPHHDPEGEVPYVVDSLTGMAVLAFLASSRHARRLDPRRASFWGAVGAGLPDLELLQKLVASVEQEDYRFPTHSGLIPHRQMGPMYSGISQVSLVVVLGLLALLKWRRRARS